jgi:hypothetical protein
MRPLFTALLLLCAPATAQAHDTVLLAAPGEARAGQPVELALSSVVSFPTLDYGPLATRVASTAASSGTVIVLERRPEALRLRLVSARPGLHAAAVSLKPHTLTLPPAEVAHYLDEIGASPEIRALAAADPAFRETYVKYAKTLLCIAPCGDVRPAARALGQGMEFVAGPGLGRFVLLRSGRPLAGQAVAVQAVGGERRTLQTDPTGGVDLPADTRGLVLLSAVRLRPPSRRGAPWTSEFATLTFNR